MFNIEDKSILKDKMGRYRTQSLFYEQNNSELDAIFTLKDYDYTIHGVNYPSLKKMYLEIADITEYEFSQIVFGSWKHWQRICNNAVLKIYVEEWREELEVKIRSRAIRAIYETAKDAGSKGTTAAKYIADGGWKGKRGRPSKEEIAREKKIALGIDKELDEDADRMGVH